MKRYTVKQLAGLSGVTVRTLHHYDRIGLLRPASIGDNSYRYYGRDELLRLQEILFHRELGVALADIPAMLGAAGSDRIGALRRHRARLEEERARLARLIRTIDDTISDLTGEKPMLDQDIFKGFAPPRQAEYENHLIEHFGEPARRRIVQSKARLKDWSKADFEHLLSQQAAIERALGEAIDAGLAPDAPEVQQLVDRHYKWVCLSWRPDAKAYAGLGQLYYDHPDFRARYENVRAGMAEFLKTAMDVYARDRLR